MRNKNIIMALAAAFGVALFSGCNGKQEKESPDERTTVEFEPSTVKEPERLTPAEEPTGSLRLIVLKDKRCDDRKCRTDPVVAKLRNLLGDLEVAEHDWSEEECKRLAEEEGIKYLPAFLFEKSVEDAPGYRKIARHLRPTPKGERKKLNVRSDFDPRAEICDNEADDTGNGLVDCADPTCKGEIICRKEIPNRLDVFVMSQCPFGTKALDSMKEVLDAFGGKIDFNIYYIASERGDGFKSLHGQPEVEENIRELCAIESYPDNFKYMDYIWCRDKNIKNVDWKKCTGSNGIDAAVIEKCSTGEKGAALLRENIKLARELKITSSPRWIANNRYEFHAIPPETIKQEFCKHNEGKKGCEKKLSTKADIKNGACE